MTIMKHDVGKIIASGTKALQEGNFKEAQKFFKTALHEVESGQDKLLTAVCLDQLGETYFQSAEYNQAEFYYLQAYQIRKDILPPGHEDIVSSLNNLSAVYFFQGKYALAKPLSEQLIAIYETVLGKDHPEVATCMINLGLIAIAEGKFGQAEKYFTQAHDIRLASFGEDHLLSGNSLSHLGVVYMNQNRFDIATKALRTALAILEKNLGPEHPDLEKVTTRLVDSLEAEGKNAEAERLYPQLISLKEISLGPAHPDVIASLEKVAAAYLRRDKPSEAAKLYQRLLAMKRRSFGDDSPQIARQLTNLAFVQQAQKLPAQAESLFLQALHIYEKHVRQATGSSTDTINAEFLAALRNLATFYDADQRFARAEKEWRRLLQLIEAEPHKYPEFLMLAYERLSNCLLEQNKNEEAELILRKALSLQQSNMDKDDIDIRQQTVLFIRLANILKQSGRYNEAETYYKQALDQLVKFLGPNHAALIPAMEAYADLLSLTFREAEAEHMLSCARNLKDSSQIKLL